MCPFSFNKSGLFKPQSPGHKEMLSNTYEHEGISYTSDNSLLC